ncbi:SH3 domain-containing protein [Leptospira biflexa]|uniref:SH3 domain-containing protein n=1 Tax=Leptospira biflexa TaxID=172 RepID=UPI0010916093|nr:SH3 domain-containing protein [Leptospira biflexa]TGM46663.1 SH3 domain-containing protein [Leptospira biflexa]TGM50873.1 SH3 domain-containing protein [Leptospira biflexa]
MNFVFNCFLCFCFLTLYGCLKSENPENTPRIGEFYIFENDIPIYETIDRGKRIGKVKIGDSLEIVEGNVPDKKKGFWYKVIHKGKFGFIPMNEELQKKLLAFGYKNEKGRITASSLRVRDKPSLNGNIIGSVRKDTFVEILGQGFIYEKIDSKYDTWMKIRTSEGLVGYSYAGYISKFQNSDLNEVDATKIYGFIEIIEDPEYFVQPGGREVTNLDPSPCGYNKVEEMPRNGTIHLTESKYKDQGITYYKIEYNDDSDGCYYGYRGWISEKQVIYFDDIYSYTLKKYGAEFNKKFLDVINQHSNQELNVKTLTIIESQFAVKEPGYVFYEVNGDNLYYEYKGKYHFAGKVSGEIGDINNDGTMEIIQGGGCGCLCSEALVSVWNDGKIETIFRESPAGQLQWFIESPYLIAIRYEDSLTETEGEITHYELKNNRLMKIEGPLELGH